MRYYKEVKVNSTLEITSPAATVHLCSALRVVGDSIWKSRPFFCQYQAPVDDWASRWGELTGVQRRGRMNVGWSCWSWCHLWLIKKDHGAFDVSQALRRLSGWLFFFWFFFVIAIQVAAVAGQSTVTSSPPSAGEWKGARWRGGQLHFSFTADKKKKKKTQAERWQQPLQKHSGWSWRAAHWHHWSHSVSVSIKPQPQSVPSSQNQLICISKSILMKPHYHLLYYNFLSPGPSEATWHECQPCINHPRTRPISTKITFSPLFTASWIKTKGLDLIVKRKFCCMFVRWQELRGQS